MPYRYPPEFRRKVLDLVAAGRSVASIAADLGVSDQTIYTWRKQELIDTGVEAGLTTVEAAELRAAKRRIAELETELSVTRRANELLKEQVASPKGGSKRFR
jgi:transposase-like protein